MNVKFNIPVFLIVFFVLLGSFYTYIGICDPGGKFYSFFLDQYLNLTDYYAAFLSKSGTLLLNIFGKGAYEVYPYKILFEKGGGGVSIGYSCMGAGINSFWIAFVAAHKIEWKKKLYWIVAGLITLIGLNILRVALVAIASNEQWNNFDHLDHHLVFNIACYCMIFGMIYLFARMVKKSEVGTR